MVVMGYRELATRPVLVWALVAVGARLPVAMAPLALVFLMRDRPGGYAVGAGLAAAYVMGEVVGAAVLGSRLRPERARGHLAVGLGVGAGAFAGLGFLADAHVVVLGVLAALAGAGPGAAPGGLRTLLAAQLPDRLIVQALSAESVLTSAVWAAAPALTGVLALTVDPSLPLLLAAVVMLAATAGLWAQPAGWATAADRDGVSMVSTLVGVWPIYLTGAAATSLLALAELVLPALLEQRAIAVGWAGPLLAGFSIASAAGAALYGLRGTWPGSLRTQSLVLLLAIAGCVTIVAAAGALPWIAGALFIAGVLAAGVQVSRALSLREALPPSVHAAAYSVMYAATGVGYATSAMLAGALQRAASPSVAVFAGIAFTLLLIATSALGEPITRRHAWHPAAGKTANTADRSKNAAEAPGSRGAGETTL